MRRFYLIGFGLLLGFDTLAQTCFKLAGEHALPVEIGLDWALRVLGQPWVYGAVLGYIGAFFCWMSLLRHAPIGPAFAVPRLAGAALIVGGVVCLALAEPDDPQSAAQPLARDPGLPAPPDP
jgi:hypothetical protein